MIYYAQKLPLPCAQPSGSEELVADMAEEEEQFQDELDENPSEQEQPTLWEILKAVNKCTASVDK